MHPESLVQAARFLVSETLDSLVGRLATQETGLGEMEPQRWGDLKRGHG